MDRSKARFPFNGLPREAHHLAASILAGEMVLVAGHARAGKSTFAGMLAGAITDRGLGAVVVPLDSWILSHDQRRPDLGFQGRHDFAGALALIARMHGRGGCFQIPDYDRPSRTRIEAALTIDKRPDDVMVVEGVSALVNPGLAPLARIRVFVRTSESVRRARLFEDYRQRGLRDSEIMAMLDERASDEYPLVAASAEHADVIIDAG